MQRLPLFSRQVSVSVPQSMLPSTPIDGISTLPRIELFRLTFREDSGFSL